MEEKTTETVKKGNVMVAGIFVGTVGRDSAESVAYLLLSVVPVQFAVAVLFVVSCFVSLSMGTSVGTITLITPIAIEQGLRFAIREGGRTVGSGVVASIIE